MGIETKRGRPADGQMEVGCAAPDAGFQ